MIDRYTKVCLTVIALSLAVIGFRGLAPFTDAVASNGIHRIAICDSAGHQCAEVDRNSRLQIMSNRY